MRLEVPLENPGPDGRHVVELRVTETYENARQQLPIFERRDTVQYRVYTAQLRPPAKSEPPTMFEYAASGWANAHPSSSALTIDRATDGLSVATDPRKWAYSVEYGPLRAPVSGSYRFEIACTVLDGAVMAGVLSGGRHFWIPAAINVRQDPLWLRFDIRVDLRRHEVFWLMLFNDHPEGDAVSRFVVHGLSGSAAPASLVAERRSRVRTNRFVERCALAYTKAVSRARRWWRGVAALPQRGREWLVRCADATPSGLSASAMSTIRPSTGNNLGRASV